MVHIAYVVIGVIIELTICSLPDNVSSEEQDDNLLSTLSIMGEKSSILGLVVPIGSPKYVNGIGPNWHPKVRAKESAFSVDRLIGIIKDLL